MNLDSVLEKWGVFRHKAMSRHPLGYGQADAESDIQLIMRAYQVFFDFEFIRDLTDDNKKQNSTYQRV
jgi:hypothetical protein